ncbi:MAG: hypothetical protein JSR26_03855 [Proteobacteria bacterium]|nr:hypothetical protein [Pseudomonadota bacterium]
MDPFTWIEIAFMVISTVISIVARPKNQNAKPATLQDFNFPQFDEGTPKAVIFGDVWSQDWMVLAYGDLRTTPVRAPKAK